MLKMGLLWFDDNPKRPLAEKLEEAAQRYQERFDMWPTLVHLNPTQAEGLSVKYKRLRVFGDEHLRRNYFIVGIDETDAGVSASLNPPATPAEQGGAAVEEAAAEPVGVAAGAGLALTVKEEAKPRRSRRQHSAASVSSVVHRRTRRAS